MLHMFKSSLGSWMTRRQCVHLVYIEWPLLASNWEYAWGNGSDLVLLPVRSSMEYFHLALSICINALTPFTGNWSMASPKLV